MTTNGNHGWGRSAYQPPRGACALIVGLPLALCASTAHAAIMCSDDFEGAGNCGTWAPQMSGLTGEWSVDSTEVGNKAYRRVDQSGTTGKWNDATDSGTYGDVTVTAHVRIESWNATGSDQAAVFGRWGINNGLNWYSVAITSDGWMHIRRSYQGTVTNLLDLNDVQVQPGEWFTLRLELKGSNPVWVAAYLDNVFEGAVHDNTQTAISQGQLGLGSFGADVLFDDIILGDANDAIGKDSNGNPADCFAYPEVCRESGESSLLDLAPSPSKRVFWLGKAHPQFDRWAMNDALSSTPWARRGL